MKSRLTLHLDEDLKERAEQLARRRGTSVSKIVEGYFRRLLLESPETTAQKEYSKESELNAVPDDLPPRTRRMLQETSTAAGSLDLGEDTRTWIDKAHEKHK